MLHVEPLLLTLGNVILDFSDLCSDVIWVVRQVVYVDCEASVLVIVKIGRLNFSPVLAHVLLIFGLHRLLGQVLWVINLFRLKVVHGWFIFHLFEQLCKVKFEIFVSPLLALLLL